ncbi:hypothetical protein BOO91_19340 [Vibrio navarrensis]|nr:hypothetical protein UF06_22495 [Vibrio sp. S234-5]MBE3659111.1 hypothetical protein [Vibrio navarrensis]MBE3663080.1 hypothetical protein [Vibrio navarrensis]MBE4605614.1 hypothetical protein [Vibrio navarrensis]
MGKARAEEKVLGPGPLVLGKDKGGKARADKAGTRLIGNRLLGRARAEKMVLLFLLLPSP